MLTTATRRKKCLVGFKHGRIIIQPYRGALFLATIGDPAIVKRIKKKHSLRAGKPIDLMLRFDKLGNADFGLTT